MARTRKAKVRGGERACKRMVLEARLSDLRTKFPGADPDGLLRLLAAEDRVTGHGRAVND